MLSMRGKNTKYSRIEVSRGGRTSQVHPRNPRILSIQGSGYLGMVRHSRITVGIPVFKDRGIYGWQVIPHHPRNPRILSIKGPGYLGMVEHPRILSIQGSGGRTSHDHLRNLRIPSIQ